MENLHLSKEPYTILFFGRSGSGKGTQSKLLKKMLEDHSRTVNYLETGKHFRGILNNDTFTSRKIKQVTQQGGLLPVFLPMAIMANYFMNNLHTHEDLITDGVCRRPEESLPLDQCLKFYERKNIHVIYINVARDWAEEKLEARGRVDDTPASNRRRQEWFDWQVIPALSYFHEHDGYKFHDINGEQSVKEVFSDIVHALNIL